MPSGAQYRKRYKEREENLKRSAACFSGWLQSPIESPHSNENVSRRNASELVESEGSDEKDLDLTAVGLDMDVDAGADPTAFEPPSPSIPNLNEKKFRGRSKIKIKPAEPSEWP